MKVYIETLGCKVNFADSAKIAALLSSQDHIITNEPDKADIYIINSCSVTHRAERECRQIARRLHIKNPDIDVIITGCSVLSPSFVERSVDIPFVKFVKTSDIPEFFKITPETKLPPFYNRSRPFIKIQEGCDRFCSYCIVPHLRGRPKSITQKEIISEIKDALQRGFQEIVLVGTHIMLYRDEESGTDIFNLLKKINDLDGNFRIRLSSIEPYGLSEYNIRLFSTINRLCAHFHISLQSGSNKILKDMNRHYTTNDFRNIVYNIKTYIPEATIGSDIITGFPSEDNNDFEETIRFISGEPIDYLHIFRFSPRKGTPASSMRQVLTSEEIKRHSDILLKISFEKRRDMIKKYLNKDMDVIITENSNKISGLTHNYIKVILKKTDLIKGHLYRVNLKAINQDNTVTGEIYEGH